MAYSIDIRKTNETTSTVEYSFDGGGFDIQHGSGLLSIDKISGEVNILKHQGTDWERLYDKVIMKLAKHWQASEFPEKTSWQA